MNEASNGAMSNWQHNIHHMIKVQISLRCGISFKKRLARGVTLLTRERKEKSTHINVEAGVASTRISLRALEHDGELKGSLSGAASEK